VTRLLTRRFHLHALPLLLALALPLAGCGEDTKATFKKDFKPLNARILVLGRDVGSAVTGASGKSDRQIQLAFGSLSKRTATLQKDVNALKPPDELAADKKDLVDAMGNARDALADIEKAAGASDPQAARRGTIQLVAASQDLRSERQKLARATGAKQ
jgi:hypothetical protein